MTSSHTIPSEIKIDKVGLRKHFTTLTERQKEFARLVVKWIKNPQKTLVVISGGPGTGKSYVVKNTLDYIKTRQLRMSYTARSAVGIGGKTIHSTVGLYGKNGFCTILQNRLKDETDLLTTIKKSREILNHFNCFVYPNIIVIDEISMVDGWLIYWLIRYFMDRTTNPLLFVCMGDPHQLNPIKSIHNLFNIMFNEKKFNVFKIHLTESKRFVPKYEEIINDLRAFVDKDDATGMFTYICDKFPVTNDIDRNIILQANRAMAFKNGTVDYWNEFYIKNMVMGPETKLSVQSDKMNGPKNIILKPGCMVFVTRNYCSSAHNGTPLIFQEFDSKNNTVICRDPKTDLEVKVGMTNEGLYPLDLGFAGTIHKYQGDTIDDAKIIIDFNESRDLNLVYTALSRMRQMDQILAINL